MSLSGGMLVALTAAVLSIPVAVLISAVVPSSRPDELAVAVVGLVFAVGFVRGAVLFVVFGEDRLSVVNPVRVYRIPVEDIGSLFETFVPVKGRPPGSGSAGAGSDEAGASLVARPTGGLTPPRTRLQTRAAEIALVAARMIVERIHSRACIFRAAWPPRM